MRDRFPVRILLLITATLLGAATASPAGEVPLAAAFDWTHGTWEGFRTDAASGRREPMTMRVEPILGGAGQSRRVEVGTAEGAYHGFAVQVLDAERSLWVRRYTNAGRGTFSLLEGRVTEEGTSVWRGASPGRSRESKLLSESLREDGWRRTMSVSEDGGATWRDLWVDELRRSESAATAQASERPPFPGDALPKIEVLLLGTFHFDDAGLDEYKPEHRLDVLGDKRQREIEAVLDRLAAFRPTRIAVEVSAARQAGLDERYAEVRSGDAEPSRNEVEQIGFRLAARLGHERVWAVDAPGRSYFPEMSQEEWDARAASLTAGVDPARIEAEMAWDARFEKMYRYFDELKTRQSLREHLIEANDERRLLAGHGHYLVGSFKLGRGDDYFGADAKTRWYNRNLRIFQNVQRIPQTAEDRILVVIGAGHVPILRHCVEASPEYELVEVRAVLGDGEPAVPTARP